MNGRPALARDLAAWLGAINLLVHLPFLGRYGWFRDELYYVASTDHLAFGYVDHPPLSIALLAAVRAVVGDSLPLLRLPAVVAGTAAIVLIMRIARELGGGRFAQGLAGLVALAAPVWSGAQRYYSMNALDLLFWCAAALLFVRILIGESPSAKRWGALGAVLGIGLLNKVSVLFLGVGLAAGFLATPRRRLLAAPGAWGAVGLALLIFLPHLIWQGANDWPTLEFMRNAAERKNVPTGPLELLSGSLLEMNPVAAPLWLLALGWGLLGRAGAAGRGMAAAWAAVYAVLAASGTAKPYYLAGSFVFLMPLAGLALERITAAAIRLRWLRPVSVAAIALSGILLAPFALPILPPDTFAAYARRIGVTPPVSERHALAELPQHFADMFGWQELADTVARVHATLPAEEKSRAVVYGQNYGEAGAIDVLGRPLGLPRAVSGHNSYWLWGPGEREPAVILIVGGAEEDNREVCASLEQAATFTCDRCMPYESGQPIYVCRGLKVPLAELWPRLREFI